MSQELAFLDHLLRLVDATVRGRLRRRRRASGGRAAAARRSAPRPGPGGLATCRSRPSWDSRPRCAACSAEQQAIDTTGHNIANANTPGYSRQTAVTGREHAADDPGASNLNGGAPSSAPASTSPRSPAIRDQFLDVQYRAQNTTTQQRLDHDAVSSTQVADRARRAVGATGSRRSWLDVLERVERPGQRARRARPRARRWSTTRTTLAQTFNTARPAAGHDPDARARSSTTRSPEPSGQVAERRQRDRLAQRGRSATRSSAGQKPERPDGPARQAARRPVLARAGLGHRSRQRPAAGQLRRRRHAAGQRHHRQLAAER